MPNVISDASQVRVKSKFKSDKIILRNKYKQAQENIWTIKGNAKIESFMTKRVLKLDQKANSRYKSTIAIKFHFLTP